MCTRAANPSGLHECTSTWARNGYIAEFEKPKTSPNSLNPSTTVLSPYLKFGCVSPRVFYHALLQVYKDVKKHTPPSSLAGRATPLERVFLLQRVCRAELRPNDRQPNLQADRLGRQRGVPERVGDGEDGVPVHRRHYEPAPLGRLDSPSCQAQRPRASSPAGTSS